MCRCFKGFRGDGKTCTGRVVTLIIYCNVNDLISDSLSRCTSSLSAFVLKVLLSSFRHVFAGNSTVNYGEVVWIFFFHFKIKLRFRHSCTESTYFSYSLCIILSRITQLQKISLATRLVVKTEFVRTLLE